MSVIDYGVAQVAANGLFQYFMHLLIPNLHHISCLILWIVFIGISARHPPLFFKGVSEALCDNLD